MDSKLLFGEKAKDTNSPVFFVPPYHCVVLTAFGLSSELATGSDADAGKILPSLVLQKAINKDGDLRVSGDTSGDKLSIFPNYNTSYIEDVVVDGSTWCLTACNNVGIITLPGVYRLRMSLDSMVGTTIVQATQFADGEFLQFPEGIVFGGNK